MAHLIYGIWSDGCFILLNGDAGTGKITVCRCLPERLPKDCDIAINLTPKLTAFDLLKIILIGQSVLCLILANSEMSQVNNRITSEYHLNPLHPQDVRIYIQHRNRLTGDGTRRLFSDRAVQHVARLSKGIPRLINLLCD